MQKYGWHPVKNSGETYWLGPLGNQLYLHTDGTWYCESAPQKFRDLQEYLIWYADASSGLPK